MNLKKMLIGSVIFLAAGAAWIVSFWNGSVGFGEAHPVEGSKLSVQFVVTGWPALGGVALTLIGTILLLGCAVMAVFDLARAPKVDRSQSLA